VNSINRLLGNVVDVRTIARRSGSLTEACAIKAKDDLKASYIQFLTTGNTSKPVGRVTLEPALQPFAYRIENSMEGPVFTKFAPNTDELYLFESGPMKSILSEIDRFWGLKESFSSLGFLHNRGLLVEGPPGTGKSSLFQQVTEMMVNRGDVIFFTTDVSALREGLKNYREVEPERKVVVVFEDVDEVVGYSERALLQLMDGDAQIQNVLYLASTNYLNRIPPRLLRPGRFDKVIHLGPPAMEARQTYLKKKLEGKETPEKIKWLAEQTNGLSFGHLRELIIGGYALKEPIAEVLKRLRGHAIQEKAPAVNESVNRLTR
jgi:hypothetical protein